MKKKQICSDCFEAAKKLKRSPSVRVSLDTTIPIEPCAVCTRPTSEGIYLNKCDECGNELGHATTCSKFIRAPNEAPASELRDAMVALLDQTNDHATQVRAMVEGPNAISVILSAVANGATLEVQGRPRSEAEPIRAWLESSSGARHARAAGKSPLPVLVALAETWQQSKTIDPSDTIDAEPDGAPIAPSDLAGISFLGDVKLKLLRRVHNREAYFIRGFKGAPTESRAAWVVQRPTRVLRISVWGAEPDAFIDVFCCGQHVLSRDAYSFCSPLTLEAVREAAGALNGIEHMYESARSDKPISAGPEVMQDPPSFPSMSPGQLIEVRFSGAVEHCVLFCVEIP